ncbi:3-deoxy-D-manno-octulosonate 8-phosphate phosphatase [Pseudomonas sp. Leaf58]|nr:3-deoxy-D-manno-octulosonate 8-phosphate phosphatase [Pseudomonas sp. Leaf58]
MQGKSPAVKPALADIRLVITDVDGVLTDGGIYYDSTGECLKRFHVRDGMGMRLLEENGVRVAVLSGRDSATLRKRISDLGISLFQLGVKDKLAACNQLIAEAGVTSEQTACIGDDCIDLPAFAACRLSFAVADAPHYVKAAATHTLTSAGGTGAFREVADAILFAQNKMSKVTTAEGYMSLMNKMAQ